MHKNVQTSTPTRYRLEERDVATGAVTDGPFDLGTDPDTAWATLLYRARDPRYTPHAGYRLVLLARDGAR